MDQRISLITLGVADLGAARAFYEALGWECKEVEETVFVQAGGSAVVLWGREKLADDAGLPGQQLVERSGSEAIEAAYEQNRQDAIAADVFGSPAYVLDGEVFWGQDRIELLADALKSGRSPYRSEA